MKNTAPFISDPDNLRQKAEEFLKEKSAKTKTASQPGSIPDSPNVNPGNVTLSGVEGGVEGIVEGIVEGHQPINLSETDMLKLIHELELHQEELAIQNEELRQAIEKAESAIGKYAELYDFAAASNFTLSRKGEIIDINLTGSQMIGTGRHHLKNSRFGFSVSDESKPIFNHFLERVFKSKTRESCELRMSDDGYMPAYVQITGILSRSGEQCYITVTDITRLRKAEVLLQESEVKFHSLFTHMAEGAALHQLIYNKQGVPDDYIIHEVNPAFERKLGLAAKTVQGLTSRVAYGLAEAPYLDIYAKVTATGEPAIFETYFSVMQKHFSISVYSPFKDHFVTIFDDITEKKKAEQSLRESLTKYKVLFDLFPLGITVSDSDGKILETNSMAEKLLGVSKEVQEQQSISSETWKIVRPDGSPMPDSEYASTRALKEGRMISNVEMGIVQPNKQVTWINVSAVPIPLERYGVAIVYNDITHRKQVESEQRESDLQYRALANSGSALIWRSGTDKLCNYFNEIWLKFTGRTLAMEMGNGWAEGVHPDDLERCLETYITSFDNHETFEMEYRLRNASGEYRWLLDIGTPNYNISDEFIGYIGHCFDITERKNAVDALLERETEYKFLSDQFEAILDHIPGPVFYKDKENRFIRVNKYMALSQGKTKDEMVGLNLAELYPEQDAEKYYQDDLSVINSGVAKLDIEECWQIPEGTKWVSSSKIPFIDTRGEIIGIIGLSLDITERKLVKEKLQETNAYLENLINYANAPIIVWDPHFRITRFNQAFEALTGHSEKEVLGQSLELLFPPASVKQSMELLNKTLTGERMETVEIEIQHLDGEIHIVLLNSATLFAPHSLSPVAIIAQGQDITKRKKAEQEVLLLNVELEQRVKQRTSELEYANKELEAFSYSVAHNLFSPLRGIDGWSMAMLEDNKHQLDEKGLDNLNRVRSEAQRMGSLIDDLLKLSRVARFELQQVKVDLTHLAQTYINQLKEANKERKFEITIAPGMVIIGDLALLQIALANLLENAFKFTEHQQVACIEFGRSEINGKTTYFIRDNGVGFDKAHSKNLFEAFHRMHKQVDFPGTGIGLAIVKRIISRHGGHIWAESKPGEGATFYFTVN